MAPNPPPEPLSRYTVRAARPASHRPSVLRNQLRGSVTIPQGWRGQRPGLSLRASPDPVSAPGHRTRPRTPWRSPRCCAIGRALLDSSPAFAPNPRPGCGLHRPLETLSGTARSSLSAAVATKLTRVFVSRWSLSWHQSRCSSVRDEPQPARATATRTAASRAMAGSSPSRRGRCRRLRPYAACVDGWQLAVGVGGLVLAGLAAFFAWRDWERGRNQWELAISLNRGAIHDEEMPRPDALFIVVEVRCRRNSLRVERVIIRHDKRSEPLRATHSFPQLSAPMTVEAGHSTHDRFLSDRVANHNREHGPIRQVCWVDAEDKAHCEQMPGETLAELLADARVRPMGS
jgi:hypothetical protein